MELLPYDTALGQDASGDKKPAASTSGGQLLPYEEATGAVYQGGYFFQDKRFYKDAAGYVAGVGAQLSDMFTGLGKSLLGGAAYLMDRADSKGSMVAPAPRTADAPPVTAAERANVKEFSKQASARGAQVTKDMFPEELATPWLKVAKAMGPEAVKAYEDNGVGWVMGKIGEIIEKGGKAVEGAAGIPASDVINAVDLFTGLLGARALKPQAQAMLKTRIGQMRSDMKAAEKSRPLTPEEMAKAYTGTEKFRGGDAAPAKAADFEATQEMPAFDATQPIAAKVDTPPTEGARPLADVLDPYKIPAIAAGTAAGVWAMQNQLDDEQLAALGLAGAAAIVRLDGVPEPRLVDMLKQGGATREAAAAQIYRDNVPMLTRSLRKYEKQGVQIEDVVQRTMEKGLRAIEKGQFSGDSAIATYLFRIADNEAKSGMRYEKVRPQTESMDLDETPGAGKGDESKPSPHENIADESLTGRSPEQVALNNALGAKMAAALDGLPENFRRPFEMRELEGMEYAEIAEALGQPIGTVRSQINRAKEALQQKLREYRPEVGKVALVTGGAALAANQLDAEELAAVGLAGAGAMGAIKGKGGMWHPGAAESLTAALKGRMGGRIVEGITPDDIAESVRPANEWVDRSVKSYLNKHAGTETDPLKDITLPTGESWGDTVDAAFTVAPSHAWKWKSSADKPPNATEPVAGLRQNAPEAHWDGDRFQSALAESRLRSYLEHVGDYLKANVDPAKLPQYDLVRAVKETKAWDERMAKEAAKAEAREANVALKRMESMTVAQDFPGTGMKLVKLDKPGDFAHESTVMGHSVRGYEPYKPLTARELRERDDYGDATDAELEGGVGGHPDWVPESEKGMDSARFSSGDPNYGLGGWDAIKRGDAEILSLRDAKGGSHVTIEIDALDNTVQQIRGKGNAPVPERYQQQIADFLNSREWDRVGDLDNAGITELRLERGVTQPEVYDYGGPDARAVKEALGGVNYAPTSVVHDTYVKLGAKQDPRFPWKQRGSASPEMMFTLAAATAGATLGAFLDEESPLKAGIYGALTTGFLASSKGRSVLKQAIKSPDTFLGLVSTRLGKIAPELKGRVRLHELRVLKALDTVHDQVTPFLDALRNQPKAVQELVARELMNGKTAALSAIPELAAAYPKVRATLANVEGQLQSLGRFAEGVGNYFPRIVKDYDGLKNVLGKLDPSLAQGLEAALVEANAKMMRKEQRGLTEVEQSVITNRYLFQTAPGSTLPGYAKARQIREVTEKIQPFYEAPAESLLRYLSGAITDIEAARFFGRDIKVGKSGKKKFTNVDESIGNLTARLLEEGKINSKQAMEVRDILRARFVGGEQSMNAGLGAVRNITNTALLGQFASAATQIGDSLASVYHFGLVPTLQGVVQKVIGSSKVTPKDLGLVNHLAEELSNKGVTGNVLHKALKYTGFQAIDLFAKQVNINAALNKYTSMARSAKGRVQLAEKYGYAFEGEVPQLIADLRSGVLSPRTQRLAFEALSDVQPISRAELPQAYLEHPNGRLLYQLKTYMLKQGDIVRRDAYDNIATRDPKKIMTGLKNLAGLATLYAFSSVPGDVIKDWLSGREVDVLSTPQLVENVTKTFGLNRYSADKLGQGKVVETGIGIMTPPLKVIEDILAGREKAVSYLPGIGRPLYDRAFDGNEKREIAEKKAANKGLPKGTGQVLSDEAKAYLEKKRKERKEKAEAGQ